LLHFAAKLVPCVQASDARRVRPLPCDFEDIAEAVIVKAAHGVEVRRESIAVTCLQLRDQFLDVGGDDLFRGLPLLRLFGIWGGGGDGVHGCFLLGLGRCFSCHAWHVPTCRTPPGEGGGSKAQWGGVSPTLAAQAKPKQKGRSEAEVCTSEARKIGETPCAARSGQSPLAGLSTLRVRSPGIVRVGVAVRTQARLDGERKEPACLAVEAWEGRRTLPVKPIGTLVTGQ